MRFLIYLIIAISFLSCSSSNKKIRSNKSASIIVHEKIISIQKQIAKQKVTNPNTVNEIVNLSGIVPKDVFHTHFGIVYTPTHGDIIKWLEWYNENQNNFYFDKNHDILNDLKEPSLFYLSEKEKSKIIFVKNNNGIIRFSISFSTFSADRSQKEE